MALQPFSRPAGSSQVLRFAGTVTVGDPIATFPKQNGEMTSGGAVTDKRGLRFLLADATNLDDQTKQFPSFVFDDTMPAGAAPHATIQTSADGLVTNVDEIYIGSATWAQNTYVLVKAITANLAVVFTEQCLFVRDTLTSGLGTNTGLPVLIVPVQVTGSTLEDIGVDILIEIRETSSR